MGTANLGSYVLKLSRKYMGYEIDNVVFKKAMESLDKSK